MKKLAIILTLLMLVTSVSFASSSADEFTIFSIKENYQGAMYEPVDGLYLGAYVLQDVNVDTDMEIFNKVTDKKHVTFFRYVGYGRPFPTQWVEETIAAGAIPHIAWEPNDGLQHVEDNEYLRTFARDAKAAGGPIFLRYASEMNGDWCAYSGDPAEYIEKWKIVYNVMREEAPNVAMLWSVFTFPEGNILDYYPGDEYVDWVGVNIYNVVYHNNNINDVSTQEDPLRLLDYVYDEFSYRKPIHISEYGVTHFTITDDSYHVDFAIEKLHRLYENLPTRYPRVKAISYFNVNNLLNAPEGRKINNYSLTGNEEVLEAYKNLIKDEAYLSDAVETTESWNEVLSFNHRYFFQQGSMYVDVDFFTNHLGLQILKETNSQITLTDGITEVTVNHYSKRLPRTFYNRTRLAKGLPLRQVAETFGYRVDFDGNKGSVWVRKR